MKGQSSTGNTILYVSTYPPRECGIATFTQDLTEAFDKRFNPATRSRIVAINDNSTSIYNYPQKAVAQITAGSLDHYVTLAEKINAYEDIKVVNIQHEFGIFGGNWGDYLMPFLQVVKKPVVTTFHSVLPNPEDFLKGIVRFIAEKSKAIVVMNELSKQVLESDYQIPKTKIHLIPHGIPQTAFETTERAKAELGLEGKKVISTFGLLNRDKGIEYAIRALPAIVRRFPDVTYLVLGATHPVVQRQEGEEYRNFLIREVERLGLKNHVKFYNKYLNLDEIVNYLKATDIYVSPMLNPRQSVSGTLSYALGCGRPAISTKSEYAKHLITAESGVLVEFKSADSISKALARLLGDEKLLRLMSQAAYETTRKMIWPNVAAAYFRIFRKFAVLDTEEDKLPQIKFDHVRRLTDDFGIFQFARYSKPDRRHGYSLDDNARALIAAAKFYLTGRKPELVPLMQTYLNFIRFTQRPGGSFANIVTFKKQRDKTKDDDVQGRGIWALGYIVSETALPEELQRQAERMFMKSLKIVPRLTSARAIAFAMTGLYFYLKRFPQRKNLFRLFEQLAKKQVQLYKSVSTPEWQWFEDSLTYSNSKIPESLFYAYELTKNKRYLDIALITLKFLRQVTFGLHHYSPIGQAGWYFQHEKRAYFDQQPEDAASMVETKVVAYKITGDRRHLDDAFSAFQWFLGKNHLNQMVYDEVTGGCHDGVGQHALNFNQGAESTISYLLARLALEDQEILREA